MNLKLLRIKLLFIVTIICFTSLYAQDSIKNKSQFKIKITDNFYSEIKNNLSALSPAEKEGYVNFGVTSLNELSSAYSVKGIKPLFNNGGKFEKRHQKFGLHLWYTVTVDENTAANIDECIKKFGLDKNVTVSEPFTEYALLSENSGTSSGMSFVPNDPQFSAQWHYNNTGQTGGLVGADIDLVSAWDDEMGDTNVIVAIIDVGVQYNHPDLADNMWVNYSEKNGTAGVDDDGNGFTDDIYGYNFVYNTGNINYNSHYHGTHVAGTVSAVTNNGIGVSGIAGGSGSGDGVRLMSCQIFDPGYGGGENALVYAADNGAVIAQNSWGNTSPGYIDQAVLDAVDYFIANAGFDELGNQVGPMAGGIVIFAAGNSDSNADYYPAYYESCFAVASTNHNDQKAWYSNYGTWVEVSAPGGETNVSQEGVLSTYTVSSYNYLQGTSMACPHVSGVAALIVSKFQGTGFSPDIVWERLISSADPIDDLNPTYTGQMGSGRLNAYQALEEYDSIPPANITDLAVIDSGVISITLSLTATGASADSGKASAYDLRYSESLIDSANFESAIRFTKAPKPKIAGELDTIIVTGILPNTTYYFAIKAIDNSGYKSGISNVISVRTLPAPRIEINPATVVNSQDSGLIGTQVFTINNTGQGTLNFNIANGIKTSLTSLPLNLAPVQKNYVDPYKSINQIKNVPTLYPYKGNKLYSGGRLFGLDYSNGLIVEMNITTGAVINSITAPEYPSGGPDGLAFDGEYIYFINDYGSGNLYKIDVNTGNVVDQMNLSSYNIDALAHTGEYILAGDYSTSNIFVIDYESKAIVNTISLGLDNYGGLCYSYSENVIYTPSPTYGILKVDFTTSAVIDTISYVEYPVGLAYSESEGLLFAGGSSAIYAINPSTEIVEYSFSSNYGWGLAGDETGSLFDWLALDTLSAQVPPGESFNITATFDSDSLSANNYFKKLKIESNDPVNPVVNLSVQLHVNGIPNISLNQDSLNFGEVFVSYTDSLQIIIANSGTDSLIISNITTNTSQFNIIGNTSLSIPAKDRDSIYVGFMASSVTSYTDTLKIFNNVPSDPIVKLVLKGKGVNPPIISVIPDSIGIHLFTGDSVAETLTINNTAGGSNLYWNANYDFISSPSAIRDRSNDIIRTNMEPYETAGIKPNINPSFNSVDIPFKDGFESGSFSDWTDDWGSGTKEVTSATAAKGTKSFHYANTTSDHFHGIHQEFNGNPQPEYISFSVRSGSTSLYDGYTVFTSSGVGYEIIWFMAGGDGLFYCNGNVGGDNSFSYSANTWYKIEYKDIDWVNKIFDYYVDGNLIKADIPFRNAAYATSIDEVYLYNYEYSEAWWDEINVGGSALEWLSLPEKSGTVASGTNQDINVVFDAEGLYGGLYTANINISSNDPATPSVDVPVSMVVTGLGNICTYNDSIYYEIGYIGYSVTDSILITNCGTDSLKINDIVSDNPDYTVDITKLILLPEEETYLNVHFSPSSAGVITGNLNIHSNDSSDLIYTINLIGNGDDAPVIAVDPDSVSVSLFTGDTLSKFITIDNSTGGSDLIVEYNIENLVSGSSIENRVNKFTNLGAKDVTISDNILNYRVEGTSKNDKGESISYNYPMSVELNNTYNGVHVMFYYNSWSSFRMLLEASGATTSVYYGYITNDILDTIDILVINDDYYPSASEITLVNNWIQNGGSILIDADQEYDIKNALINGSGILYNSTTCSSGTTTDITSHEITDSVTTYYIYGPVSSLDCSGGSISLIRDNYGRHYLAVAPLGDGKVVAICDESLMDGYLSYEGHTEVGLNAIGWLSNGSSWVSLSDKKDTISAGHSVVKKITFDATDKIGGNYNALLTIASNDPANLVVEVPLHMKVTGIPNIEFDKDTINYGITFIGQSKTDTLEIYNSGTDSLIIHSITSTSTEFSVDTTSLYVLPDNRYSLLVTYSPLLIADTTAILTIESNDSSNLVENIILNGNGANPPIINIDPTEYTVKMYSGDRDSSLLYISNLGDGYQLEYNITEIDIDTILSSQVFNSVVTNNKNDSVLTAVKPENIFTQMPVSIKNIELSDNGNIELADLLDNLNENITEISDLIPDRYNFSEGLTGSYINDGGGDMYNDGNELGTNIGGYINYTNNQLTNSSYLGNKDYFTFKHDGIFIFAADIQNVNYFTIDGNLGADGSGSVDGAVIQVSKNGKAYLGFIKRVYNAGNPSVNHLVIVPYSPAISHDFSTYTNDDYHQINGLSGSSRIYHLLFAGTSGNYINNNSVTQIMSAFIDQLGSGWLNIEKTSGIVPAHLDDSLYLKFDATELYGGDYYKTIVVQSNDPVNPDIEIPVHLNVTGIANIELHKDSINFGQVFIGDNKSDSLIISNTGTDTLYVHNITSTSAEFSVDVSDFFLLPEESYRINVTYSPTIASDTVAYLLIDNNDSSNLVAKVTLTGIGQYPPVISVTPDSIAVSLYSGDTTTIILTIDNSAGQSHLDFDISFNEIITSVNNNNFNSIGFFADKSRENNAKMKSLPVINNTNPVIENTGDVINTFLNFVNSSTGMVWVEGNLYVNNYNYGRLDVYSIDTQQVVRSFPTHNSPLGITYDGTYLWIGNDYGNVYGYDLNGNSVGSFSLPFTNYSALTWDGTYFVVAQVFSYNPNIYKINYAGAIIETYTSNYNGSIFDFEWVSEHEDGHLWINDYDYSLLRQINLENDVASQVNSISFTDNTYAYSIAHNGTDLWYADMDGPLFQLDDGIIEGCNWAKSDIISGSIPAGSSQNIAITFDAEGKLGGNYNANMIISNNDPLNPVVEVPLHMEVTGIPNIEFSRDTIDFGEILIGGNKTDSLFIQNTGTDTLFVHKITSSSTEFKVDKTNFVVLPDQIDVVNITYTPTIVTDTLVVLSIESNDSSDLVANVVLTGTGIYPPVITISPDSIEVTLKSGDSLTTYLVVSNETGQSNLSFSAGSNFINMTVRDIKVNSEITSTSIENRERVPEMMGAGDSSILVIQDNSSWGVYMYDYIYNNFGISSDVIWSQNISSTDLSNYDLIITVSRQYGSYYDSINANKEKFEDFVKKGGIMQYQVATMGDAVELAGNALSVYGNQENYNDVVDTLHPIVEGVPNPFYGSSANLNYINNLPVSANIITRTTSSLLPTTVEYQLGHGYVVATGTTIEYLYNYGYPAGQMLYNMIAYNLEKAGKSWLKLEPETGNVAAGQKDSILVTIDASNVGCGDFKANIQVASNDPLTPVVQVPVHLVVNHSAILEPEVTSCSGGSVNLSIANIASCQWCTGETTKSITVSPAADTIFSVSFVDNYGCNASENVYVFISKATTTTKSVSICEGDSIYLIDKYVKEEGIFIETLSNVSGCDSIVITDLNLEDLPAINLGKDVSISTEQSVTLDAGNGYIQYKWNTGETTQTITVDGSTGKGKHQYSVKVVDENSCSNSDTIVVNIKTGIFENAGITYKLYPNPVNNNKLFITTDAQVNNSVITLYNMNGQVVKIMKIESLNNNTTEIDVTNLSAGTYILKINVMGYEKSEIIEIVR